MQHMAPVHARFAAEVPRPGFFQAAPRATAGVHLTTTIASCPSHSLPSSSSQAQALANQPAARLGPSTMANGDTAKLLPAK